MTTWAGDVLWAGGVRWALGAGETLPPDPGDFGWPSGPIGSSHTMIVPSFGGQNMLFRPELWAGDRDVYAVDFVRECLGPMNDTAANLLACHAIGAGITVTPRVAVGQAVADGVVQLAVDVPDNATESTHRVLVQISTVGGRELTAVIVVQVLGQL